MKVKSESEVARSCLTLSDPMDCSPPGSSIHGIFQARVLEWGAIAFSVSYSSSYLFTCIWYAEYALLLETQSTISVTPSSPGSLTLMTIVSVSLLLCFSCLSEWWFPLAICHYSLVFSHEHFPRGGGGLNISVITSNETIHTPLKQDLKVGFDLLGFWLRPQDNRCQLVPCSKVKFYSTWAKLKVESTPQVRVVLMYLHKLKVQG